MLKVRREDMRTTPQEAIEAAREDPEMIVLPDDWVIQKDRGFDDEGMFIVVSKNVNPLHWEDRWTCVGMVSSFT